VHCFTYFLNVASWWGTRGSSTIAIGAVRCDVTRTEKSAGLLLSRISTRWPRNQIFNSYVAAESIQHWRRFFVPKRLFVVSNGVDLGRFSYVPLSQVEQVSIVGVGSLRSVKRWDRVLMAAATLQQRGLNFLVRIVGGGPLNGSLQQQAEALGVADHVAFLGDQENIPEILANATFLVHPSDSEGSPNAVMEAMSCGRAVVATDVGDIPYVVDDGKTGFVVCRGDNTMLIDRMAQLITERDLCRRMGEAGRLKAEREFGLDQLIAETLSVYRTLGWKDC
jgi:glycosyltransferase involved in cell wall biosynthesis